MRNIIVLSLLGFFLLFYSCNSTYTSKDLAGVYVNNYNDNLSDLSVPHEAPARIDTLTLFEDYTFTSNSFGEGIYKIYKRNGFAIILLEYSVWNRSAGYEMNIKTRGLFRKITVFNIGMDGKYYCQRIE